jgi:cell division septum initiation protein DivIVA
VVFLSPAEIKQQQLREKRGAYEREDVDALIDNVVGSYQHVWLERERMKARVEELEREIANTKELEKLLRDGLASAQRAAEQVKEEAEQQVSGLVDKAREEAEALLAQARAKAEEIVAASREERDRLDEETSRLEQANHDVRERYKAFLLEALSVVEATAEHKAVEPQDAAVAQANESAHVPEDEELEAPVGWLATVPLTAVVTDEVDQGIERAEPAAEAAAEPEPASAVEDDDEDVPATVLLSAVAPLEESTEEEPVAEEPGPAPEEPEAAAEEPEPAEEPVASEPVGEETLVEEPAAEEPAAEETEDASTDEHVLAPAAAAEPEPQPEPEPEPAAEPEAAEKPTEPEEDALPAPDEAYLTFRAVPAIKVAEPEPSEPEAEGDEEAGDDSYEDWSPKKS